MKPGKLYIKIFLSFIMVLFVTLSLNYVLYYITVMRYFQDEIEHYTNQRVFLLRELIEKKYWSSQDSNLMKNQSILALLNHIGELQWAEAWITDSNSIDLIKSFSEDIPSDISELKHGQGKIFDDVTVYYDYNGRRDTYAVTPLDIENTTNYTLNIIFRGYESPGFNIGYTMGFLGIGIIIALLIIPVSRLFTKRLKQLRQSALRIAIGDFSHRINVDSSDEIGELSLAFNQMADEIERMIVGGKELTAMVSHELRTPLTRIRIAQEILGEKLDKDNFVYTRHLNDIREDIDVLDRLIGRILELSKIDMHEPRFRMEPFDLSEIIRDILLQLKPIIERKELTVQTDLVPVLYRGHEKSMITALLNILDNAVKYTVKKGKIYVNIRLKSDFLQISVVNTFKKLKDKDLISIFEPFQRLENSDSSGSGLGLSIAHKIITRHGGKAEAFNREEGLEITVTLPAVKKEN